MHDTLKYYNQNSAAFTADTQSADMSGRYALFLNRIPQGGHILDLGCGSGRDTAQFIHRGYRVTAMDGSEELCRVASAFTGQKVHLMRFDEMTWQNEFDGVWASASLLHCVMDELPHIIQKISDSLKPEGILYASFKYGDFTGIRTGRYYTDLTEDRLAALLETIPSLQLIETVITGDVRPGREQELWLNAIIKKR